MRLRSAALGTLLLFSAASAAAIQHPLTIDTVQRQILAADGSPVVFHAASPWHLVTRLTLDESAEFLGALRARGFDALLMTATVTAAFASGSDENVDGEAPFLGPVAFAQPNEIYFQHLDAVLDLAESFGLTVFLFPAYLGKDCGEEGWCQEMLAAGPETLRSYGRWIGARYRDRNGLIWAHGGDADASVHGALEVVDALAQGIREVDPIHLHTAHCARGMTGSSCYDLPWLDFDTVYADCATTARALHDAVAAADRPVVYVEGRYEFEPGATPVCIRSQSYWSLLGGAAGQFFGSGKIWDFPAWWRDGLESDGDWSMRVVARVQRHRSAGAFQADLQQSILIAGAGDLDGTDFAVAGLAADHSSIVVYVPTPRTISVSLDALGAAEVDAWWIDPLQGNGIFAGRFAGTGTKDFAPPLPADNLLVLDDVAAQLDPFWEFATAVDPAPGRTTQLALDRPYPNPFNPRTTVAFEAPSGERIVVGLFDARGRHVKTLFDGPATGGKQTVQFDATALASGVYRLRASTRERSLQRSIVLLR